jgi:hypothetical protein
MDDVKPIINKVAQKGIVTLDLEEYFPKADELVYIDLKDYLFKGLILREADFREAVKNTDWALYKDKYVGIHCSADAVIPMWAYMVLASELEAFAKAVVFGRREELDEKLLLEKFSETDITQYNAQRLVIKGCGDRQISPAVFVVVTNKLSSVARSIMYGEPCSTVPVFKKRID